MTSETIRREVQRGPRRQDLPLFLANPPGTHAIRATIDDYLYLYAAAARRSQRLEYLPIRQLVNANLHAVPRIVHDTQQRCRPSLRLTVNQFNPSYKE